MSNIDSLNYLGTFATIDEVYAAYPSGGVSGNFVIVDGSALYWDESLQRWASQGGGSSDDTTINGTLAVNDLVLRDGYRTSDYVDGVKGSALRKKNGQWVLTVDDIQVSNGERFRGQSSFRMQVFTRSEGKPAAPNGGEYSDPQPYGTMWGEGVPQGTAPIWVSSRIYTSDSQPPQSDWSDPIMLRDNENIDVEFSPHNINSTPASPSETNLGSLWFDPVRNPNADWSSMNWFAIRYKTTNEHGDPEWGSWVILPTKGAKGADGDGFENVFYRTALKVTPMPTITSNDEIYQQPNYCPNVSNRMQCGGAGTSFTASPRGVSEDYPYEWVMQRRKQNGVWQRFSLPCVIFATYSKQHTVTIGENGHWYIDGEDTGKTAIGKDGAVATVKGRVDVYADSEKTSPDQTSLESFPLSQDVEVGDCWVVENGEKDGDPVSGHLFLYVGGNHEDWGDDWQDLGEFKGEKGDAGEDGADGHSQYLYIAWATEVTFSGNPQVFSDVEGYTTNPAEGQSYPWMGIMVSETEIADISDESNAADFKWNYMPGRDGTDYENVYIRTKIDTPPEISEEEESEQGYQNPEYTPAVDNIDDYTYAQGGDSNTIEFDEFTDDPNGISEEWPYEWQSRREKINGVWGAFQSPAILHRNWAEKGEKGADGAGQAYIRVDLDQVVIDCDSSGHPKAGQGPFEINARLFFGDEQCTITQNISSAAVNCEGFGTGLTKCSYMTSVNSTRAYVKLTMRTAAVIASGMIVFSLTGVDSESVTHTATLTIPIIANMEGQKGDTGSSGPVLRFRGPYLSTEGYTYNSIFRDCVKHNNVYWVLNTPCEDDQMSEPAVASGNPWTSMGVGLKFFATELLLAENATIQLLNSNRLIFTNTEGNKTAGINEDGEGSYRTYYPGTGNLRKDDNADGWTYYYNNDEENTLAWKLGPDGVVIRENVIATMQPITFSNEKVNIRTVNSGTTFTMRTLYLYSNSDSQYHGCIFDSGNLDGNGNPTGNLLNNDGLYSEDTQANLMQEIDQEPQYVLRTINISGNKVSWRRTILNIPETT